MYIESGGVAMATRLHRTQILLEPEQHSKLAEIARREGRSISDVVRTMLDQQLQQRDQDIEAQDIEAIRNRRLAALERIREHKEAILKARGGRYLDFDIVEAINQAREEQDERNWAVLTGAGD
jgi:Ribbon-helix-helix protein, copG family